MNPEGVEHHVQLANCLCLDGRGEEAWQMIQALYRRFPEHPAAMHYMGKMLDEHGEHERGFALMKKAIKLDPANERFLADLSFAYMMRGNAGAAMICSEEAMALNPDDEVVQFIHEVAVEFEKQESEKKRPEARAQWRKRRNSSSKASQV
jgi:tetratricopeptide (TPR) repeat protein